MPFAGWACVYYCEVFVQRCSIWFSSAIKFISIHFVEVLHIRTNVCANFLNGRKEKVNKLMVIETFGIIYNTMKLIETSIAKEWLNADCETRERKIRFIPLWILWMNGIAAAQRVCECIVYIFRYFAIIFIGPLSIGSDLLAIYCDFWDMAFNFYPIIIFTDQSNTKQY